MVVTHNAYKVIYVGYATYSLYTGQELTNQVITLEKYSYISYIKLYVK